VGFYAPPSLQGVVTHAGDPFHYHWVNTSRTETAHLDAFGMKAGAELILPAK
jgi:alpha-acetolactate decarboxylase